MKILFILSGVLLVLVALFLIRSAYERRHPRITEYTVRSPRLPESFSGMRIAFLTDLHGKNPGRSQEITEALLKNSGASLVLFGGDMMTVHKGHSYDDQPLRSLLHAVPEGASVYFSDGNHEIRMAEEAYRYPGWAERYDRMLREEGVIRLKNCRKILEKDGQRIVLSSVDLPKDAYENGRKRPLPADFFRDTLGERQDFFEILLMHQPQYLSEAAEYGADLTLSGHFHGGTIRLPLLGGVMTPQFQFFSKYTRGFFDFGGKYGIVSGGLGTHTVNIRFMNRPELLVITLEKG